MAEAVEIPTMQDILEIPGLGEKLMSYVGEVSRNKYEPRVRSGPTPYWRAVEERQALSAVRAVSRKFRDLSGSFILPRTRGSHGGPV